mmetsp:Transcript_20086/g.28872  ORF Transcript_20086/g.28872 Transcript_20086/m.28872 type:complete len:83 (-) Transcript_20086:40-288(-)
MTFALMTSAMRHLPMLRIPIQQGPISEKKRKNSLAFNVRRSCDFIFSRLNMLSSRLILSSYGVNDGYLRPSGYNIILRSISY